MRGIANHSRGMNPKKETGGAKGWVLLKVAGKGGGAGNFLVPATGLYQIHGWGGASNTTYNSGAYNQGASYGGYFKKALPLLKSQILGLTVGAGGAADSGIPPVGDGGSTIVTLDGVTILTATGGTSSGSTHGTGIGGDVNTYAGNSTLVDPRYYPLTLAWSNYATVSSTANAYVAGNPGAIIIERWYQ